MSRRKSDETFLYKSLSEKLENIKNEKKVRKTLKDMGIRYDDYSERYGYLNLRIPTNNGYIRIYQKKDKSIEVQEWNNQGA